MKNDELRQVMRFHLDSFDTAETVIDDDTIHNTILKENDGFGPSNSKNIYKLAVMMTLKKQNKRAKKWPANWMEISVGDLADSILA